MGKAEVGSAKWLGNKIKSKGSLQKLRWYCQMCEKQCRDQNGFKCHVSSESHQRQLLLFAENTGQFLDSFSQEFESDFLTLLKRTHGTKRTFANAVYQEYIKEKEHVHMNATKWVTLTGFIQYLGKSGKCTVDETEKGWYITWIDRDPETIARQEASQKAEKLKKDDEERNADFILKQVALDRKRKEGTLDDRTEFTDLVRTSEDQKIKLGLNLSASQTLLVTQPPNLGSSSKVFKSSKKSDDNQSERKEKHSSSTKRKSSSNLSQIMAQEIAEKKSKKSEEASWLMTGIHVKVITKSLGDKYYKQKGYVKSLVDDYTAVVVVASSGSKVKLDQSHLETVIPAIGRHVMVLSGKHRGKEGVLLELNVKDFSANIELTQNGNQVTLFYEQFSKKYD
eukprot:03497.XXX_48015_49514_1 [CDS] Oithona nana genome sequencing.